MYKTDMLQNRKKNSNEVVGVPTVYESIYYIQRWGPWGYRLLLLLYTDPEETTPTQA